MFAKILKANPYHDEQGLFTSKDKAKFVSIGEVFDKQRSKSKEKGSKTQNFAEELSSMPTGKASDKAAKSWVKSMQEKYDSDNNFRSVVDAIGMITQGEYMVFKEFTAKMGGGDFSEGIKGSMIPKWENLPVTPNPLAKYKNFFKNQDLGDTGESPTPRATYGEVAKMLNATLEASKPLEHGLYRGLVGRQALNSLADLKEGDLFDVGGATSFTSDEKIARDFSEGNAKGQSSAKRGTGHGALIEIEKGAKALPVSALSPWDQKEFLSRGKFKVKSVTRETVDGLRRMHVVLSPVAAKAESDMKAIIFDAPFLRMESPVVKKSENFLQILKGEDHEV